ncbi:cysteine ABC transporter substrate-binding protein [Helicobacter sp. MIT 14-3879]|uniref:cysteine ABC transporter substrate-binding protein n=1 Tax=Helicobacter sp. MIT 14-3879 TaxID=2040649 RepID=UPI000E1F33B2|nr:cysteine ABC transporter substrate-binding protein [Helicobacter sp. MIT 14-3879]RDU62428.1 ABC transporter substrate-binding protein [Helicobacter sp. MIT 14-3879]
MKAIYKALIFLIIGLFLTSCSENTNSLEQIKNRDKVIVGVFGDKPPFGYVENGENKGFDIYIAKRVAKELLGDENKIEFILVEAQNRVEFPNSNRVDIIFANFTKTPEREEKVDFALPYMKVALGVVSKDGKIKSIDDLKDKTLIVNKGTTADFYFTTNHPEINLLKFDQNTEAFLALKNGRGDALAHDNLLLFAWAKSNPDFKVGIEHLGNDDVIAPAVKKGNTELLNKLNEILIKLGSENFISKAYDETLSEVYGKDINKDSIIIEPK